MTSRIWRYPDLRNGSTFHHITDTHFGGHSHAQFVNDWLDEVKADASFLKIANNTGHIHTGDMIHWYYLTNADSARVTEESWYTTWRNAIKTDDSLPFAEAVGNHDLLGAEVGGVRSGRTSSSWATAMGLSSQNNAYTMGQIRIITIGPDTWVQGDENPDASFILSTATMDYLEAQLNADSKPTFIAAHIPLDEQFSGVDNGGSAANIANTRLNTIIASHSNVVGWLSGHRHMNVHSQTDHARVITVNGKKIFAVCGPSCGGGRKGAEVAFDDHQWQAWNYSMYLTYFGDALDVRWRDHNTKTWVSGTNSSETVRHLSLTT